MPTAPLLVPHAPGFAEWLPTIGEVLVAGGLDNGTEIASDAELFDPALGSWEPAGKVGFQDAYHVVLDDGRVLAGTSYGNAPFLFDPKTKVWTPGPTMATARTHPNTTLLPNGDVMVFGGTACDGQILDTTEILSGGATGTFGPGPTMAIVTGFTATVTLTSIESPRRRRLQRHGTLQCERAALRSHCDVWKGSVDRHRAARLRAVPPTGRGAPGRSRADRRRGSPHRDHAWSVRHDARIGGNVFTVTG